MCVLAAVLRFEEDVRREKVIASGLIVSAVSSTLAASSDI